MQADGADPVVKTATFNAATGSFTVPGRTTAVFVEKQKFSYRFLLFPIFKDYSFGPIPPNDEDKALVRPPVEYGVEDNRFYFVLTDRFANGSTANDYGTDPGGTTIGGCTASWLPADERRLLPRR